MKPTTTWRHFTPGKFRINLVATLLRTTRRCESVGTSQSIFNLRCMNSNHTRLTMKRSSVLGREDLWCVIEWADTGGFDVVKGDEVCCDSFKVNSSVRVKYKNAFYEALVVEITNTKEEAKQRLQDIERQTYTGNFTDNVSYN